VFERRTLYLSPQAFTSIVEQRASLIRQELLAERNVLYLDVDVVLMSDPLAWLEPGYDIWASLDHPHVFCTGSARYVMAGLNFLP
jgi:hypothetical protein